MWIKSLTMENYQDFIKWSKKAFDSIDSVSIPTEYVYRTLGAVKAFEFTGEFQGERHVAAMRAWQTLWVRNGYQDDRDILEQRRAYIPMLKDILLDDVLNEAPNDLYQTYLSRNTSGQKSILYRFMQRSEENARWVVERFSWVTKDPVLVTLLNHNESPEDIMSRYWKTLLSSVNPSDVTIKEFLEYAQQHQDIACAACTSDDIAKYVVSIAELVKARVAHGYEIEIINVGMRRILTILFTHRPELETFFYQQLNANKITHIDCGIYASDAGLAYTRHVIPQLKDKSIDAEVWTKWVERWKSELNALHESVSLSWNLLKAKELLMEIERCRKYDIDLQKKTITLGYSMRGESCHNVSPLMIGFLSHYEEISSFFAIDDDNHALLKQFDTQHFIKECESTLGKKRVQMIQKQWNMGYFLLHDEKKIKEWAYCAREIATKGYRNLPNIWYFGQGKWGDGLSDKEFIHDYYHNMNIKTSVNPPEKEEMELFF